MRGLLLAALCLGAAAGCRIEDHTPTGTRRDEVAVQEVLARYTRGMDRQDWDQVRALFWRNGTYSGPLVPRSTGHAVPIDSALRVIGRTLGSSDPSTFQVRSLRTDLRQEGDLATAWLTLRRTAPIAGGEPVERDWVEHLVLRRIGSSWRILSVAGSSVARGSRRDPR
ncbi:MAG TPA: nuclear transport factor 2 family protein [Gemmatimonadales bacterium]|nr:nuclear transport factor 2 family protein [Gemmatimonadales bacterium]